MAATMGSSADDKETHEHFQGQVLIEALVEASESLSR
jgi:hypothetical protein